MNHKVTIIWPDAALADELSRAMVASGFARKPRTIVAYPGLHDVGAVFNWEANHPQVVVVGLTEQQPALEVIREISRAQPQALVAAADQSHDSELVIASMRAGATEFLSPPFDLGHLTAALKKRPRTLEEPTGRLTSVLPARGGCGASMVAVHLSNCISLVSKKRVLLIDFDFQAGSIAFRLGVNPEFTMADVLARIDMVDELWQRLARQREGFEVLAAPASFKSLPLENLSRLPELFCSALRTYSHVIVDMPPGMFSASEYVLDRSDQVYLVTTPEVVALHLARRRVTELLEMGVPRDTIRLVVNRIDSRQPLREKEIQEAVGLPVALGLSNDYEAVSLAALKGKLLSGDTTLGRQLHSLACQIAGPQPQQPETSGWKKLLGL